LGDLGAEEICRRHVRLNMSNSSYPTSISGAGQPSSTRYLDSFGRCPPCILKPESTITSQEYGYLLRGGKARYRAFCGSTLCGAVVRFISASLRGANTKFGVEETDIRYWRRRQYVG
jgi:hypothetical protein